MPSARPQSRPDRHLTFAVGAARKQKVRQVHTANQQYGSYSAEEQIERPAQTVINENVYVTIDRDTPSFMRLRIVLRHSCRDRLHLFACLFQGHIGLQSGPAHQPAPVSCQLLGLEGQGCQQNKTVEHASRHHPDHGVRFVVEADGVSEEAPVRSKLGFPNLVTENHNLVFARLILIGRESPPQHRLDATNIEVGRRLASTP